MWKIQHRVNTLEQLHQVPIELGAEIDIRYHNNDLVLHHDPLHHHTNNPLSFDSFLQNYHLHGPLILNIKTEGIEEQCWQLLKQYQVTNFFFLDLSMPYFVRYAKYKPILPNLAVRFSEHEPMEYAMQFSDPVTWVWVDCFTRMPLDKACYEQFKQAGFKICIVSPELQNHPLERITEFQELLKDFTIDAVCTKRPNLW